MSTVEIDTGTYIKRFAFWNPATWSIPKLYWDAWSQEQRLHAICRQLEKVIAYADYLGVNTDDIAARMKAIEEGQLDPVIEAAIEEWFEENEPEIVSAIENLNDKFPIETDSISDGAVTSDKLAENSVTNSKIADRTIRKSKIVGGYFAVIGDSFSNESDEWPTLVAAQTGLTPIIKAVGSTGFVTGTKPFINQLNEIASDSRLENIEYIIVYGGTNDYTVSNASIAAMKSAFNSFLSVYNNLAYKPKLIFAFCNLGHATRSVYNDIGSWYSELCNYLKEINMPGFVDNVAFWLFPFAYADVFENDLVHPNAKGHKIIASYFMQILNGCYSGVRGYEIVISSSENCNSVITFVNGNWNCATRLTDEEVTSHNSYINIGSAAHTYAFGTVGGGSPVPAELVRGLINITTASGGSLIEINNLCFNPRNRNVYLYSAGSTVSETLTGVGSVSGNCLS